MSGSSRLALGATLTLVALISVVLQASLIEVLLPAFLSPDLTVLAIVVTGLLVGPVRGATAGFAIAFLLAVSVGGPPGMLSLAGAFLGYWAGRWGEVSERNDPTPLVVGAIVGTLLMHVGVPLLDAVIETGSGPQATLSVIGATLVTVALARPYQRLVWRMSGLSAADSIGDVVIRGGAAR